MVNLKQVIEEDCRHYERVKNKGNLLDYYLYLNICKNSESTGLYQLVLNGCELYYGTLQEINAVVKSMCKMIEKQDFLNK